MALRIIGCALLISLTTLAVNGQTRAQSPVNQPRATSPRDDQSPFGSPEEEMLNRAAIRHEESNHKEALERARENAELGSQLLRSFEQSKALSRDDLKKLERMEKLARSIRGRVGGSDDEDILENPPRDLKAGITRLAELAEELRKSVEKTSRHVVSASVIERSNEMIELIRSLRGFLR